MDNTAQANSQQPSNESKSFPEIKDQIEDIVNSYIYQEFQGKSYDAKEAQNWSNEAAEMIIKRVQEQAPNDLKHTATIMIL